MTEKKVNEEELKEKYMQFKQIQEHLEHLGKQAEMFNERNVDLEVTKESLEEIKLTKDKTEILAPLADGIFMKTELRDNSKLLVNIGSDTVVEKSVDEVIELINGQKKELTLKIVELESVMHEMQTNAMKIYQEVEKNMGN
jgi:prefoldin alpha subunit